MGIVYGLLGTVAVLALGFGIYEVAKKPGAPSIVSMITPPPAAPAAPASNSLAANLAIAGAGVAAATSIASDISDAFSD